MLLSELKKFVQKTRSRISLTARKSPAATLESEVPSNMDEIIENEIIEAPDELPDSDDGEDTRSEIESEVDSDVEELKALFPELAELDSITKLKNPTRYAALRDMGLSVSEAYLATTPREARPDNRAHLTSSVPRGAKSPAGPMTKQQLNQARAIFGDMSDTEIYNLYKKVTK